MEHKEVEPMVNNQSVIKFSELPNSLEEKLPEHFTLDDMIVQSDISLVLGMKRLDDIIVSGEDKEAINATGKMITLSKSLHTRKMDIIGSSDINRRLKRVLPKEVDDLFEAK